MSSKAEPESIYAGTTDIIRQFFKLNGGENLKQKSTTRKLAGGLRKQEEFQQLLFDLYETIEANWSGREPSKENWRIERQTNLSPNNRSPEVLLERAIAILGERGLLADWFNQIPVASGLVNDVGDKRAAIDLMRHRGNQAAFVELKWGSDTPVFAAVEILLYGLTFIFSTVYRNQLAYQGLPLLGVKEVALEVLAPSQFYDGYELTWLRQGLDSALRDFATGKTDGALSMDFEFLSFPPEFQLPFADGAQVLQLETCNPRSARCEALVSALQKVEQLR